jgi:hypothetical protein
MYTCLRNWGFTGLVTTALASCGGGPGDDPTPIQPPPPATPAIVLVRPSSVAPGWSGEIKIGGSGFESGLTIELVRSGISEPPMASVLGIMGTEVRAQLTVPVSAPEEAFDIVVTNTSGKHGTGRELLIVDRVPAEELDTPDTLGVVTAIGPTGLAFGAVTWVPAAGCSKDVGTPASWDLAGVYARLSTPSDAGCLVTPLRAVGDVVYGRGSNGVDAGQTIGLVTWTGGPQYSHVSRVVTPSVGHRFGIDLAGPDGAFIGHATDTAVTDGKRYPFVWRQQVGWSRLQMVPNFQSCVPRDANAGGSIVGQCYNPGPTELVVPVFWADTAAAPVVLPLPSGVRRGSAEGINQATIVVGTAGGPVRWIRTGTDWTLESLPGDGSPTQINDAGWIAGTVDQAPSRAALWSPSGIMQRLGRLQVNTVCAASAISPSSPSVPPVVGGRCFRSVNGDGPYIRPVRWRPH